MHPHTYTHIECNPHTQSITTHLQTHTHTHTREQAHEQREHWDKQTYANMTSLKKKKNNLMVPSSLEPSLLLSSLEPWRIYDITTYTFNNYIYKHAINMPKGAMNNWKSKAWHLYIYIHMYVLHYTPNNIYIHYLMINMTRSQRPLARSREGGVTTKEVDGNKRCCRITWITNMHIISTHHNKQ